MQGNLFGSATLTEKRTFFACEVYVATWNERMDEIACLTNCLNLVLKLKHTKKSLFQHSLNSLSLGEV